MGAKTPTQYPDPRKGKAIRTARSTADWRQLVCSLIDWAYAQIL